ncbi:hypothetical protein ACFYVR_13475 [Rhodococcus sp. NPDC003318]|uniref:hypothetical protein n=1 Tax=Rhodococcus sp. NPDC003318 TaxID=3364503 RepID=UPI0036C36937
MTDPDGDVAAVAGVVLSRAAAAEVVAALDVLNQLAGRSGSQLAPRIAQIRRDLATHANIRADASTEVHAPGDLLGVKQDAVVDTVTAAGTLGITADGVRYLCRTGRLQATWRHRRWWIPTTALDDYRACRPDRS